MATVVTNVSNPNHGRYDVYIGRIKGSTEHYGNPYIVGIDGNRDDVIAKCDQWLNGHRSLITVEPGRRRWILYNLPKLKDRKIGCHCKPEACHGDIYVRMLDVEAIWDFHLDPYTCFTNFSDHTVYYNNFLYKTAEHAYQAAKTANRADHDRIAAAGTAGMAKRLGRQITIRDDFFGKEVGIMGTIIYSKFTQHEDIRQTLMSTDNWLLIEGNWWGDRKWGMVKNKQTGEWEGENILGKILMMVRDIFRANEKMRGKV
jgi:ribA/ribD-fused uncharacterized protein